MARKQRRFSVFSLSFLDIMSCGFGATVLVFMLIHHSTLERSDEINERLLIEVDTLTEEIITSELYIETARTEIQQSGESLIELEARTRQLTAELEKARDELANRDEMTLAQRENINALMADIRSLEEQSKRLEGAVLEEGFRPQVDAQTLVSGDRQYLTGLKLGGRRVLVLLDSSASMLDSTIVNIIRRRNMPLAKKLEADKWRRSLLTVEWILGNLPETADFQVVVFNDTARYLIPDTDDQWFPSNERPAIRRAAEALKEVDPGRGTSLHQAFTLVANMEPLPDNIILITDGLPTVGATPAKRRTISSRNRERLYRRSLEALPVGIPVNTVLFPLEGDPAASSQFWRLAMATGGSFHESVKGLAMKRGRREMQPFGLSFLDAIACGFGAILLLLVITKVTQPMLIRDTTEALSRQVVELTERLEALRSQVVSIDTELEDSRDEIARRRGRLALLTDRLNDVSGEFKMSDKDSTVAEILEKRLEFARGALTRNIDELETYQAPPSSIVGGIPADSEYIIFVIDTSGSMFSFTWPLVLKKVSETLAVYPGVKGIQVMNDNGEYMFPRYRGRWIPDSTARRKAIVDKLRTWTVFSNSSPVQGITRAISTFYSPEKKIGIYVFGDEYTGGAIQPVLDAIDKVNRIDENGNRLVRIHAIGFPVMLEPNPRGPITGEAFATLMRLICAEHGGTFVGLPSTH